MSKRSLQLISSFLLAFALLINPAFAQGAPAQWNYSFQNNNAQALYPGQVAIPQLGTQSCLGTVSGLITAGTCGSGSTVTSISALEALPTSNGAIVYLSAPNISGTWRFNSSNLSANITADPNQGMNVAPNTDPTGASGAWQRQINGGMSQYWFGCVGNGIADDSVCVQSIFNYALYSGIPFVFQPANDLITTPVIDAASGDMSQAEFTANGSSTNFSAYPSSVLVIGSTTSGATITNLNVTLPKVVDTSHVPGSHWSGQRATGVSLINLDWSVVNETYIYGFLTNMRLGGYGEGTAYVTVNLDSLISGSDELDFYAFNSAGWSNQNTVIGGEISNESNETNVTGTHGIVLLSSGSNVADGNTIVGTSIEGGVAAAVDFVGAVDNTFIGLRIEATPSLVTASGGGNIGNFFYGGYHPGITFSIGGTDQVGMIDQNGDYLPQTLNLGNAGSATAPQILEGSGAPATGLGTVGSIYLNVAGGATTTLYVKTGSSTWTAK